MRVFISYSRSDLDTTLFLKENLEGNDIQVLLDVSEIKAGEDWRNRLGELIITADVVVFLVTTASLRSAICDWEINEAERLGKRIIPVIGQNVDLNAIPARLNRLQLLFFRSKEERGQNLPSLIETIKLNPVWLREQTRITEIVERWHKNDKSTAYLLRGPAISKAEHWAINKPNDLPSISKSILDFISACREEELKEHRQLKQLTLQGMVYGAQAELESGFADKAIKLLAATALKIDGIAELNLVDFDNIARRAIWQNRLCCVVKHPKSEYWHEARSISISNCGKALVYRDTLGTSFLYKLPYHQYNVKPFDSSEYRHVLDNGDQVSHNESYISPTELISRHSSSLALDAHDMKKTEEALPPLVEYKEGEKIFTKMLFGKRIVTIEHTLPLKITSTRIQIPDNLFVGLGNPCFSRNGRKFFFDVRKNSATNPTGVVFDCRTQNYTYIEFAKDLITRTRFTENGDQLIICSRDQCAYLTDSSSGELIFQSQKHPDIVNFADLSSDGSLLATACRDGFIRLWNVSKNLLLLEIREHAPVEMVIFHKDNRMLISSAKGHPLRIWDLYLRRVSEEKPIQRDKKGHFTALNSKIGSKNVHIPTKADSGNTLNSLWSSSLSWWESDKLSKKMDVSLDFWKGSHDLLAFSKDKNLVITSADKSVFLKSLKNEIGRVLLGKHPGVVKRALITHDNRLLVTVCNANVVCYWDVAERKKIGDFTYKPFEVSTIGDLALSACGNYMALIKREEAALVGLKEIYEKLGGVLEVIGRYLKHGCDYLKYDANNMFLKGATGQPLSAEYSKKYQRIELTPLRKSMGASILKDPEFYRPL